MTWLTEADALSHFQEGRISAVFAESVLRKSASIDISQHFDVFLSHSYLDARLIVGVKTLLEESEHLSVYVDWQSDPQLIRSAVTSETADLLRTRMKHCSSLIYVATNNTTNSRWMPWELGYFDGFRPEHTAILPLMKSINTEFDAQEYLGLYPKLEVIPFKDGGDHLGIWVDTEKLMATIIQSFVR